MNEALHQYLEDDIRTEAKIDFFLAAAALLGGALILAVGYYATNVVLYILISFLPFGAGNVGTWAKLGSVLVMVAVFYESWRVQRRLFDNYAVEATSGGIAASAGLYLLGVGWGPTGIIPLSAGTPGNLVKLVADILYSGPRLLRNAVRFARRGLAKRSADLEDCAGVLDLALQSERRISFEAILEAIPSIDLEDVFEQLGWISGVVYLRTDPPGISLTDSLRDRLREEIASRETEADGDQVA